MPEAVRLYLDEDVMSRDLVNALRSRAVDLVTAKEAGLIHIPDSQHLDSLPFKCWGARWWSRVL
jgi:hypothetical protein